MAWFCCLYVTHEGVWQWGLESVFEAFIESLSCKAAVCAPRPNRVFCENQLTSPLSRPLRANPTSSLIQVGLSIIDNRVASSLEGKSVALAPGVFPYNI